MPAIIIGDECQRDVADLSLASQLCFLQVGHPDKVHSPASIDIRFRQTRKLRSFDTQIRAAAFDGNVRIFSRFLDDRCKPRTYRMCKSDVDHNAIAKKRRDAGLCPVIELIRQYNIERTMLLL